MADQELPISEFDSPQSAGIYEDRFDTEELANQPSKAVQPIPLSFKVLVGIYLCLGFSSIVLGVLSALQGSFYVNVTLLYLIIGIGLFRRTQPWRTFGVVFSVLEGLGACKVGLDVSISWEGYKDLWRNMAEMNVGAKWVTLAFYALPILCFAISAFSIWSIFVLTRPKLRALFESNNHRGLGYIVALCVVLVALTLARETGGCNINYSTTEYRHQEGRFSMGPSLADLGAQVPLIIEIDGLKAEHIYIITEIDVERSTHFGDTSTNRSWKWEKYSGSALVSKAKSRFPRAQHVRVEITRLDIKGAYWLPLVKTGTASYKVSVQGLDDLRGYNSYVSGDLSFDRKGLSSVHDLLISIRAKIAGFGITEALKSAATDVAQENR